MKTFVEHNFTGTTQSISSYDSSKTLLGSLMFQKTGAAMTDKYAGPMSIAVARPMEQSTAIALAFPHVISWSSTKHWVFLAENSTAATTRRIVFYEYDIPTSSFNWVGFITMNFVSNTGNKTIRGFRALRTTHTTGTVAVSGTSVTGTSTQFSTERIAVGARIGFGSTNPNNISQWYDISAIGSDTSITLNSSAGTISSGTSYVIEELRFAVAITNATATNGGLFLVKGINPSAFSAIGLNISEAATTDNIRGIYWLADAATVTNTVACGLGIDDTSSNTQHFCWVLNGTTTAQIFKYNLRATLGSLSAGKSTSAFSFATGTTGTLTGTSSQVNNGRMITASHGPGSGVKSFYFATTTRIYRVAESSIIASATNFLSDNMVEIPPGSANTYAAGSAMQSIDYSDSIDRFIIISSGAAGIRSYITKYNTISDQFDHIFLIDSKQTDQSSADSGGIIHPTINATAISVWSEFGILYLCRNGITAALNQLYAMPISSHWTYAATTNQRLISPSLSTDGARKLYKLVVASSRQLGDGTLGASPEPFRTYIRTSGISDNSGSWHLIDDSGDLSGMSPSSEIQVMIEFKAIGTFCIPNRIYSVTVTYENSTTDSHYNPSVSKSNISSRIFAWRQISSWGGTIPTLYVNIYNADTGSSILNDSTSSQSSGTFQYSTDGTNWNSWDANADNVGNYIRYTATTLPNSIPVRAIITQ